MLFVLYIPSDFFVFISVGPFRSFSAVTRQRSGLEPWPCRTIALPLSCHLRTIYNKTSFWTVLNLHSDCILTFTKLMIAYQMLINSNYVPVPT